jgi:hypothetical protein
VFKTQTVKFSFAPKKFKEKTLAGFAQGNLQKKISCNFQLVVEVGAFLLLYTRGKRDKEKRERTRWEREEKAENKTLGRRERRERKRREFG